jgi:hypothetical protein
VAGRLGNINTSAECLGLINLETKYHINLSIISYYYYWPYYFAADGQLNRQLGKDGTLGSLAQVESVVLC